MQNTQIEKIVATDDVAKNNEAIAKLKAIKVTDSNKEIINSKIKELELQNRVLDKVSKESDKIKSLKTFFKSYESLKSEILNKKDEILNKKDTIDNEDSKTTIASLEIELDILSDELSQSESDFKDLIYNRFEVSQNDFNHNLNCISEISSCIEDEESEVIKALLNSIIKEFDRANRRIKNEEAYRQTLSDLEVEKQKELEKLEELEKSLSSVEDNHIIKQKVVVDITKQQRKILGIDVRSQVHTLQVLLNRKIVELREQGWLSGSREENAQELLKHLQSEKSFMELKVILSAYEARLQLNWGLTLSQYRLALKLWDKGYISRSALKKRKTAEEQSEYLKDQKSLMDKSIEEAKKKELLEKLQKELDASKEG